ncbi:hemerythrin domain-containing protein [Streptomyces sp. NPDC004539]|uniref:hemerythrin domain-containing protein n=1 Tax=Streptomyces sp. NPDC004539 TaxID=3154280 RepID=UPI0033AD9E62
MGHGGDVIAELTTDHREVEELFGRIEGLPPGEEMRRKYADQAVIELIRHSVAEEMYLYPAVRHLLPDGDGIADQEIADHARAERTMKQLEGVAAGEPDFDRLIAELMAEIRAHIQDEENRLFPSLRTSASEDELRKLGDQVRHAKSTAPTRPHPAAPDSPPSNKLLAPGIGLVDRVRDALTGRGRDGSAG